jgi:hypothetical protein
MAGRIAYYGGIVTNGLILDLDAAKKDSYPGTGTAWNDISGNRNNGTLTNGPTFNSSNGGSIVFDGVDDYVSCGTLGSYGSEMGTKGITLDFSFKSTYTAAFKQFGIINTGINTLLVINFNRDENDSYSAKKTSFGLRGSGAIYLVGAISTDIYTGDFFIVSITRQPNTNQVSFYVNGVLQTTLYGSNTATPNTFSNFEYPFTIGAVNSRGSVTSNLACNIPYFRIYNRALSATEILQNYNALKGRYEL